MLMPLRIGLYVRISPGINPRLPGAPPEKENICSYPATESPPRIKPRPAGAGLPRPICFIKSQPPLLIGLTSFAQEGWHIQVGGGIIPGRSRLCIKYVRIHNNTKTWNSQKQNHIHMYEVSTNTYTYAWLSHKHIHTHEVGIHIHMHECRKR